MQPKEVGNTSPKRLLRPALRLVLGAVALIFLIVAFRSSADDAGRLELPSVLEIAVTMVLLVTGVIFGAQGWAALFDPEAGRHRLLKGALVAQTLKYIPGFVWQPAKQVHAARHAGIGLLAASSAYLALVAVQVAAAGTLGALLLLVPGVPSYVRLAAVGALLSPLFLYRRWMTFAFGVVQRIVKRPLPVESIPGQANIVRSYGWTLATQLTHGAALVILLGEAAPWEFGIPAFSLAWLAGFLAIPFPSGLGVREAVLIAALGVPAAVVIAASAAHRVGTIVAEATAAGIAILLVGDGTGQAHPHRYSRKTR